MNRIAPTIRHETQADYLTGTETLSIKARQAEDAVLARAKTILAQRLASKSAAVEGGPKFTSATLTRQYLALELATLEDEQFHVLHLSAEHGLIHHDHHSTGTIDSASVYPRRVLKECLKHNAAAVILAHNHPSGNIEPSQADRRITRRLLDTLALVDIRVLDHVIVGTPTTRCPDGCYSFAENGDI